MAQLSEKRCATGALRDRLEAFYQIYNRREFVHPDPLEVLYRYEKLQDREVAALVAGSLAYGRVDQILKSVSLVLEKMSPSPYRFLTDTSPVKINAVFSEFRYRFTTGRELAAMFIGVKHVLEH